MGIRFRKSIKINDFLKLNVSKSGVSITAGKKGASINLGKAGAFLNLGLAGTGLSYRKKISGLKKSNKSSKISNEKKVPEIDSSSLEEYFNKQESIINIHKYSGNVILKDDYNNKLNSLSDVNDIVEYKKCIDGDEDTIESFIGEFNKKLDYDYEVNVNYELENHDLFVDLDLPEIDAIPNDYKEVTEYGVVNKKKTSAMLKEEYAKMVVSLGVFLALNYFNISSYIDQVILSAFTQVRNNDGDINDKYLYSIKFSRSVFENTNFEQIDDLFEFINKFENRININNFTFKPIKPFEANSKIEKEQMIIETLSALKNLGYKNLDSIKEELQKQDFKETQEFLKYALKKFVK